MAVRKVIRTACTTLSFGVASAVAPNVALTQAATATAAVADTTDPLSRALEAEDKGELKRAAAAYREVLQRATQPGASDGDRIDIALLGLERIWAETGVRDSILPVVQRVLLIRPADPVARGIQLRTLVGIGKDDEARAAFLGWRRSSGNDGAPFREYARLLLAAGRMQAADSVLIEAGRLLGTAGMISGEVAQLHVALGRWSAASIAFRQTLVDQPYLETSALFALQRAPATARDSIRNILFAVPVSLSTRRLLSNLELAWGEPRRAWAALAPVRADDSTAAAWRAFGERAEFAQAWPVVREVWLAVLDRRTTDAAGMLEAQEHAAQAALNAGDATAALEIVRRPGPAKGDPVKRVRVLLPIEISALGELGRGAEAQQRLDEHSKSLDEQARADMARPLVAAWLRAGDLERAKASMSAGDLADDDETAGWMALYDGDLVVARKRLVRAETKRPELVDALGLLARTRLERSPSLGQAFLLLARRDSVAAAIRFTALADSVGNAAPAFLAQAARIEAARVPLTNGGQRSVPPRALSLWTRIITDYPRSPEAPDVLLTWARALRDANDKAGAITRYESLLVDYPESALLPQARRDLERLRGQVPPDLFAH